MRTIAQKTTMLDLFRCARCALQWMSFISPWLKKMLFEFDRAIKSALRRNAAIAQKNKPSSGEEAEAKRFFGMRPAR